MNQILAVRAKHFTQDKRRAWDDYVIASPSSSFFYLSGWKYVLEKTFRYKSYYLYAEYESKICGILPMFEITSLFSGRALVSTPFAIYGGVCADNDEIAQLLINEARELTQKMGVKYLELRNITKNDHLPTKELYATFIKELPAEPKKCLEDLPRKTRAAARKGIDYGLKAEMGIHNLKEFYRIYSISVRNLGSPVFPFSFLTNLVDEFKDKVNVLIVKYKDTPVASVFTLFYRNIVMPYYAGSLPEYFEYQVNNFMYLKLMEYGVKHGYRYFDFGRSKKGTGSYDFKRFHGLEPQQLYYQYYLNTVKEIPNLSPANPKLSLPIRIWQRLPVCIANFIGSKVIKFTPP